MKIKLLWVPVLVLILHSSCNVAKQAGSAYNMINCQYDYNSISNLSLAGIDLSKGLSLTQAAQAASVLSGRATSVPMSFTLNLDVKNPNQTAAALSGLQYILSIDDVEFTTGSVNQALDIPAGGTQVLPLSIGFDLATLLSGESKEAVTNITRNFIGIGDQKSKVTLQIRPTFRINDFPVTSPVYIPIRFSFGGKS